MKKDRRLEQGFTLIEIIIVLVLLGILAATAAPKYFDLVDTANQKAADAAVAEAQAQINLTFAQELMKPSAVCATALANTKTSAASVTVGDYTVTPGANSGAGTEVIKKTGTDTKTTMKNSVHTYWPSCAN